MKASYDHRAIEQKWSCQWERQKTYAADLQGARRPYYNLMMFPYPSAEGLHVGNVFAFVGSDIHGRFMRAQGCDVFEPMGFDAFGLHSENHALKVGGHPARLVPASVENFRRQLSRLGAMFDWSHQLDTTDPAYYRWTQWIFVQLHRAGLAYQKEAPVIWCPSCKTVLADEQAGGGICERCAAAVQQRPMRQWFLRITAYAQRLLENLDWIDWSPHTREAQRHWIGRSEGTEVKFQVSGTNEDIAVFTTRPDTLWGATYVVLAPEHPLVERLTCAERAGEVRRYIRATSQKSIAEREDVTREKSGVWTGGYATNPGNGQRIPVWVSDYVLMTYGTGAIMAVPAHDTRDFALATRCGLPILQVISPDGHERKGAEAYVGEGRLIHSGPFSGMASREAMAKITAWLAAQGRGRHAVHYRLRDWCISRQRYWGPPIPVIHCEDCGAVPVPEDQLPVRLPFLEDFRPDGSGKSPLARCEGFARAHCPQCQAPARRETDVSDNFLDSAWYFFRYPSSECGEAPFDRKLTEKWLPVDTYIGGHEHAVLHLMYTRFLTMAFKDLGLIGFEEPFKRFRAHGLIVKDGAKMSKSRGNVVNPDEYLDRYGVDVFRTYLMFLGPYQEGGGFSDRGIVGIRRFFERLWRYVTETEFSDKPTADHRLLALLHQQIKKVTGDLEGLRYHTAIAALMELLNGLLAQKRHSFQAIRTLLQLVCPFAPFISQELWERIGERGMVNDAPWPRHDETLVQEDTVELVIQVNGRVRDRLRVPTGAPQAEVERLACGRGRVQEWTRGKEIRRIIFVPDRLLNMVVGE
jgi:leucyl-tRNA synthetase